jgi:hypothetical protein
MNIRNTAVAARLDEVRAAIEEAEAIDIGGSRPQLEAALQAQLHLRDVIDSLVTVRDETERNISAIRRVLDLLDEPTTTSTEEPQVTSLADRPVWEQSEVALHQIGRPATSREVADRIRAIGGDPGKRDTAGVVNGLKRHLDVFWMVEKDGKLQLGLREWGEPEEVMTIGI